MMSPIFRFRIHNQTMKYFVRNYFNTLLCLAIDILLLSTEPYEALDSWSPAILINIAGEQRDVDCFSSSFDLFFGHRDSCSLSWKNKMHIFGGFSQEHKTRTQISRLDGFKLKTIGKLHFDFRDGACGVRGQ